MAHRVVIFIDTPYHHGTLGALLLKKELLDAWEFSCCCDDELSLNYLDPQHPRPHPGISTGPTGTKDGPRTSTCPSRSLASVAQNSEQGKGIPGPCSSPEHYVPASSFLKLSLSFLFPHCTLPVLLLSLHSTGHSLHKGLSQ